jgi:hypothetical protein
MFDERVRAPVSYSQFETTATIKPTAGRNVLASGTGFATQRPVFEPVITGMRIAEVAIEINKVR